MYTCVSTDTERVEGTHGCRYLHLCLLRIRPLVLMLIATVWRPRTAVGEPRPGNPADPGAARARTADPGAARAGAVAGQYK